MEFFSKGKTLSPTTPKILVREPDITYASECERNTASSLKSEFSEIEQTSTSWQKKLYLQRLLFSRLGPFFNNATEHRPGQDLIARGHRKVDRGLHIASQGTRIPWHAAKTLICSKKTSSIQATTRLWGHSSTNLRPTRACTSVKNVSLQFLFITTFSPDPWLSAGKLFGPVFLRHRHLIKSAMFSKISGLSVPPEIIHVFCGFQKPHD